MDYKRILSRDRGRGEMIQKKEISFATAVKIQRAINTAKNNGYTLEVWLECEWGKWFAVREIEPETEPKIEQKDNAQLELF